LITPLANSQRTIDHCDDYDTSQVVERDPAAIAIEER
jgi:hypothetical protein